MSLSLLKRRFTVDEYHRMGRAVKLPLYSRAGVPVAWLVDLNAGQLERHRHPWGGASHCGATAATSLFRLAAWDKLELVVAAVLG